MAECPVLSYFNISHVGVGYACCRSDKLVDEYSADNVAGSSALNGVNGAVGGVTGLTSVPDGVTVAGVADGAATVANGASGVISGSGAAAAAAMGSQSG
ncbi:hypothetical protein DFQ28_006679 [Apophysomyces sp. BC1034]|nr:hypothetical protein DFQ29_005427 [Apophysomyces sp. BC1021]KAG0187244.1 hypothetical protein DFQ28_006679 [Apophysomyces sp. BC1034]